MKVLWLRHSDGENVSVRRERLAEHLENGNIEITLQDSSRLDSISAVKEAVFGDYDLIIGGVRLGLYLGFILSRMLKVPFIGDVSDPVSYMDHLPTPIFLLIRKLEWWILERTEIAIFAESESYEYALSRGIDAILIKNAVEFDSFSKPSANTIDYAKRELHSAGVDLDSHIAIYPGTFSQAYHVTEMLATAKIAGDWEFVFIGERQNVDLVEEEAMNHSNIHYLGSYQHDLIPGFLYHADVGLCLVDAERPMKILEYGAAKLPVLAKPGKLQHEFSKTELWFVNPKPDEILRGLNMIRDNSNRAENKANNLYEVALDNSWNNAAEQIRNILQGID